MRALTFTVLAGTLVAAAAVANPRFAGDAQLAAVDAGKSLALGAKGSGVEKVQTALRDMGFLVQLPKAARGLLGPNTRQGIVNFQRHVATRFPGRLTVSGNLDAPTLDALDAMAPAPGKRGEVGFTPEGFFEGKLIRVLVVKNEHRTILFDDLGGIAQVFIDATGRRAGAKKTYTGLFAITDILDRTAIKRDPRFASKGDRAAAGAGLIALEPDSSLSAAARAYLYRFPQALLGSSQAEVDHGVLGGNTTDGPVKHRNVDVLQLLAHVHRGERVAFVESLADPRLRR